MPALGASSLSWPLAPETPQSLRVSAQKGFMGLRNKVSCLNLSSFKHFCSQILFMLLSSVSYFEKSIYFFFDNSFFFKDLSCPVSHVQLFVIPQSVARQVPLFMKFSKQEYWSGLPFPTPQNLPNPGIEPMSPVTPVLAGRFFTILLKKILVNGEHLYNGILGIKIIMCDLAE